ncbi:hypothetical protein A3Q56_03180 [Intoshia linei]|uniref:Innexin n=1 Tax=Intoshia linei TaxID=1819745 RepID=A0A177B4J7_9BILA|nr:hypothetical protein A3Q56_03180 [Intoshia linei]
MAIDRLFRTVLSLKEVKIDKDDEFADRISRQYTVSILLALAFIVTTKQFVGDPIHCWCPAYFTDSHRHYTNNICWVSNTYYIPIINKIPDSKIAATLKYKKISYYQWVPLLLIAQAIFAFIPCVVWRFFNRRCGIHINTLLDSAVICQRAPYGDIKERSLRFLVTQIDKYLTSKSRIKTNFCGKIMKSVSNVFVCFGGKRHGNYLTFSLIAVKLLYITNAILNLYFMDSIIGMKYHIYNTLILWYFGNTINYNTSLKTTYDSVSYFPRVTLCNFSIRHQARIHEYWVQCALTINVFNEKLFMVLWFWYIFVIIFSSYFLIRLLINSIFWPRQYSHIQKKLDSYSSVARRYDILKSFTKDYLRRDGLLIVHLINTNVSELISMEMLCCLWENFNTSKFETTQKTNHLKLKKPISFKQINLFTSKNKINKNITKNKKKTNSENQTKVSDIVCTIDMRNNDLHKDKSENINITNTLKNSPN